MSVCLQNIVFPDAELCAELDLYLRLVSGATYSYSSKVLMLKSGSSVSSNTLYGAFSVCKWREYTELNQLSLQIRFQGDLLIRIWGASQHCSKELILEKRASTPSSGVQKIEISKALSELEYDSLYVELVSLSESEVYSMEFCTQQTPSQDVALAIVITTFNRPNDIKATGARLSQFLEQVNQEGLSIQTFVINNGDEIPVNETPYLKVINNPNLGGAGGFSRGLVEARKNASFTHCLFMDDDASCETSSLVLACRFLAFSRFDDLALSGAMLKSNIKYMQHEAGARFHGLVKPLKSNLDLRGYSNVIFNDLPERVDYGAWWFFLFPLDRVKHLAFPFFVRGDDIEFSLSHDFRIITLNGVSTWQDDFAEKSGPMVTYLSTRSTLVTSLLHGGWFKTWLWFAVSALKSGFGLCYDRTMAHCQAAEDVLDGTDFWSENVDMKGRRALINEQTRYERNLDGGSTPNAMGHSFNKKEGAFHKMARFLTLNGHLIPESLFRRPAVVSCDFSLSPFTRVSFLRREVIYTRRGRPVFIARHDKRYFFLAMTRAFSLWCKLALRGKILQKQYGSAHSELTSAAFWQRHFFPSDR